MEKQHTFHIIDDFIQQRKWKSLFAVFAFTLIRIVIPSGLVGGGIYHAGDSFVSSNQNSRQVVNNSSSATVIPIDLKEEKKSTVPITDISSPKPDVFDENTWTVSGFIQEKDKGKPTGYWCAKERPGFKMSETWRKGAGMKIDDLMKLQFSLKKSVDWNDSQKNPKLVVLYGRKNDGGAYYSLFIPDEDVDRVGFEDASRKKVSWPKNKLPNPLDISNENVIGLEYSVQNPQSNTAIFSYKIDYTIDIVDGENSSRKEVNPEDSFQSVFPWPSPKKLGVEQGIGLGAYPGTCVKILSYQNYADKDKE
ncbi:MAG: hypothetical protein E6Q06_02710 [Candidatus Moraniibacteriota bacterium]|nr:MAG: hypothetical protein E6Q06_02710 [Candidatus Moranbacteria bacterium]